MKIYIFPNQNLYLEYRYAALNNIAIDLICRILLGRPIPRAAFYICSMYKWLTSSVTDGSVNQIRFFGSRNIHFKISQNFTKKIIVVMGHRYSGHKSCISQDARLNFARLFSQDFSCKTCKTKIH